MPAYIGRYRGDPTSRKLLTGVSVFIISIGSFLVFMKPALLALKEFNLPPWAFAGAVFSWMLGPTVIFSFWAARLSPENIWKGKDWSIRFFITTMILWTMILVAISKKII